MMQPSNSQMKQFDLMGQDITAGRHVSGVCVGVCVVVTFLVDLKGPSGGA